MARILVRRTCVPRTGYYNYEETYYNIESRKAGQAVLERQGGSNATCSIFNLDENSLVDDYCDVVNGDGVRHKVYGNGTNPNGDAIRDVYENDIACEGTSDLEITGLYGTNTSGLSADDGAFTISVRSSVPPLTVYLVGGGNKTVNSTFGTFTFTGLKRGTYAAYVQDGNNNRLNSDPVTIEAGATIGSGEPGDNVATKTLWAKYEYVHNQQNGGGRGFLSGLAWNKTTKQGYAVDKIALTYPDFYQYTTEYKIGDIVRYTRNGEPFSAYFKAAVYMNGEMYKDNKRKLPYPDANGENLGFWKRIPLTEWTFDPNLKSYVKNSKGDLKLVDYGVIKQGEIARYGWNCFYKARTYFESRNFPGNQLPKPEYKKSNQYWELIPNYTPFHYVIPESEPIDQYFIGTLYRRVYFHLQNPDLPYSEENRDRFYFVDTDTKAEAAAGDLRIIDIIKNDLDDEGADNGSAWIIADSPSLPLRFHMVDPVQDNTTGKYENLAARKYVVEVRDAQNRLLKADFEIKDEHRLRWRLIYDDYEGTKLETRIYERGWKGAVTDVCADGDPVVLSWDSGSSKDGYVPESVGATLDFSLRTQVAQQFVATILKDDRNHRVDHYRNDQIQFRGYIDATSYSERLLGAGDRVVLTATDGLGALKNTFLLNHKREPQVGRTNLLSTILSCLSRTDVNMQLSCGVNLRDKLMAEDGDPLELAYAHRTAYNKKSDTIIKDEDVIDCRTVIDAILRNFNAFLYQKNGCWHIVGLNEAMDEYEFRTWSSAGVKLTTTGSRLEPMRILPHKDATGANELYWINSSQQRTTVSAASIVTARVKLQLEENLIKNGKFLTFVDKRPQNWSITGALTIEQVNGEKAGEKAVRFSKYNDVIQNGTYLLSSAVPHLTGDDEDWMRVIIKAKLENVDDLLGETEVKANILVQVFCDGQPFNDPVTFEISSKDRWKEFKQDLFGLPGTQVRIAILQPQTVEGNSRLLVSSAALKIQPAAQEWNETAEKSVLNRVLDTGRMMEDIELVHADLPRLPGANSVELEPVKMDVYAWRHALSLEDFTATSGWKRPSYPTYTPLLETAAQDRMLLRAYASDDITGEVSGNGFDQLGIGTMLDLPADNVDGRFMVISCYKHEKKRTAQITLRKLAPGMYGELEKQTPANARIANRRGIKNYRIANVNGVKYYRVANR
ncbi:hypothetical protein [Hymenobacter sublimis]|uniref:Tip attachment protein J domain-containing protein n=1 Tax=Hymenobacter sublimis TaxID=2933777 RepID=A0ABY4JF64_9BACT|nr:hypothetical protein [Hymenobacter sublimis]UPL50532.1 hypothetical protein MWH26_06395 [Hymenobacter sublimis]